MVQASLTDFDYWAEQLERLGGKGNNWIEAQIQSADLVFLFVDGIYSSSRSHFSGRFVATVERSPLNGKSSAFSYRGIGVHYPAEYTIRQLNESKKKLL